MLFIVSHVIRTAANKQREQRSSSLSTSVLSPDAGTKMTVQCEVKVTYISTHTPAAAVLTLCLVTRFWISLSGRNVNIPKYRSMSESGSRTKNYNVHIRVFRSLNWHLKFSKLLMRDLMRHNFFNFLTTGQWVKLVLYFSTWILINLWCQNIGKSGPILYDGFISTGITGS